jgi:hypothetical protein
MLLFSVSDSTPAECHVLIEKVLQPVIANNREVIDAVEWPEDAEESQKKEEKLVEFLKSTCALISFVPRDKLRVILDEFVVVFFFLSVFFKFYARVTDLPRF